MRILELFAGYGSQALALKNLGFEVESKISEIDKYAIQAYEQLHGKTFNYGDISKIKSLGDADLWTYSFPCQDLSVAGKQAGISVGTRSGLLYKVERLLEIATKNKNQPKYLLLENVKALVSKKFKPDFDRWLAKLDSLGYNNYWQVLNAKDYGIPQNRERVFVVSIRKDVDTKGYKFPLPVPLQKRLKDILEPCVDEKYYLSADKVEKLTTQIKEKEVSNTIRVGGGGSLDGKHTWDIVIEPLYAASRGRNPENPSDRTSGSPTEQMLEINYSGCSNTLTSVQKDNYVIEPMVYDEQNGYIRKDGCVGTLTTDGSSPKHNNRVIEPFIVDDTQGFDGVRYYDKYFPALRSERSGLKVTEPKVLQVGNIIETDSFGGNPQCGRVYSADGCSPALNTMQGGGREPKIVEQYRIRKLTPRECFRLMGVKDEQFDKLSGLSNTQLYKLAGNSIVVDVLQAIFKNLFSPERKEKEKQLSLF